MRYAVVDCVVVETERVGGGGGMEIGTPVKKVVKEESALWGDGVVVFH